METGGRRGSMMRGEEGELRRKKRGKENVGSEEADAREKGRRKKNRRKTSGKG